MKAQGFAGVQTFASSPRAWRIPAKEPAGFQRIGSEFERRGLELYLHAIYLLNLASTDDVIWNSSIHSLTWTMHAAKWMGARAVTFHVGSHVRQGFDAARPRIASGLARVLSDSPAGPYLLLENSAGAGGNIGADLAELATVIRDLGAPPNMGICLDTAHAFAAGYDFRTEEQAVRLLDIIRSTVGMDCLRVLHVNDSKVELGMRRDRHENIGEGHIGMPGFRSLLAISEFAKLPLIMETPNIEKRKTEMNRLRRARNQRANMPPKRESLSK